MHEQMQRKTGSRPNDDIKSHGSLMQVMCVCVFVSQWIDGRMIALFHCFGKSDLLVSDMRCTSKLSLGQVR